MSVAIPVSPLECREYARRWGCESVFGDPPYPSHLKVEDLEWSFDPAFSVSAFLIGDMDAPAWAERFLREREYAVDDGRPGAYDDMIGASIRRPVVIFTHEGRWFVSDGFHRIASRFYGGYDSVPAVIGIKRPRDPRRRRNR